MVTAGSENAAHGIPTLYRGVRFRSRLEAKWACFFDLVGWSWVYEPFDADGWIPDFLILGRTDPRGVGVEGWSHSPLLIEVGPCETLEQFKSKASKPLAAFPPGPVTVDGIPTKAERTVLVLGISPITLRDDIAGYLTDDGKGGGPAVGIWGRCQGCAALCVTHDYMSFGHFPCGHYTGGDQGIPVPGVHLFDLWAQAGNQVQWQPKAQWKR